MDESKIEQQVIKAFHDKTSTEELKNLIDNKKGPVYSRLNYGLPIIEESDFVLCLHKCLTGLGKKGELEQNAKIIFGEHAKEVLDYTRTSQEFYTILHNENANREHIDLNSKFTKFLIDNPANFRADPEGQNGSLIIAAGLQDPDLVRKLIKLGKEEQKVSTEENGADVNFTGYFGDTAAVWSAILLDAQTLEILLKAGARTNDLGITKNSLLHWHHH